MNITKDLFAKIFPSCKYPTAITTFLNANMGKYGIDTKQKLAMFLAQCGHESGGFVIMKESYMYSADRLVKIFPKYFTEAIAPKYAKSPKIFDRAYANRMGNGDEASGDGSKYCGRGFIQLTGKNNYTNFSKSINKTLSETVTYLETVEGALESALWFCSSRGVMKLVPDIKACTKAVNGAYLGLEERTKLYNEILKLI